MGSDDEQQLREDVQTQVGETISDAVWAHLRYLGHVAGALSGSAANPVGDLADEVRNTLQLLGKPRREPLESFPVGRPFADAAATEASRLPAVQWFRQQVLRDRLLAPEKVASWIETRAKTEGPGTRWVTLPDTRRQRTEPIRANASQVRSYSAETLAYAKPPSDWLHRVPIRSGGQLEQLKAVAVAVAHDTGWIEPEAVAFILAGVASPLPAVSGFPREGPYLRLAVHPAASPRVVAAGYSRQRALHVAWAAQMRGSSASAGSVRVRAMSEKHLTLAQFMRAHPKDAQATWAALMTRWNSAHGGKQAAAGHVGKKDWAYTSPTNFADHAVRAMRRWEERYA